MKRYLVDTHIVLWCMNDSSFLPDSVRKLLSETHSDVYYSVICPWELAIKQAKGKIDLPDVFYNTLPKMGFKLLPVEEAHVHTLRSLPALHGDPFDRMLAAQAKAEKMTLVTCDKNLAAYPIETLMVSV